MAVQTGLPTLRSPRSPRPGQPTLRSPPDISSREDFHVPINDRLPRTRDTTPFAAKAGAPGCLVEHGRGLRRVTSVRTGGTFRRSTARKPPAWALRTAMRSDADADADRGGVVSVGDADRGSTPTRTTATSGGGRSEPPRREARWPGRELRGDTPPLARAARWSRPAGAVVAGTGPAPVAPLST
jgi:hypothetical protein